MHLLFISSLLPDDAPASGFEIANRAIVEEYRRQGVRLSFAGFRRPGSPAARPGDVDLGEIEIENGAVGGAQKLAWLARAFAKGLPVSAAKVAGLTEKALREKLRATGPVDGYILNSVQMPTAYPFLATERPAIFVAHNVEHGSAAENADNARSFHRRLLFRRESDLLRMAEARICREATVVHTLSRADAEVFGLGADPKCHPLALSIGRAVCPDDGRRTHDVGLIGTWSWAPNRVGLDWFVEEVVPLLPADMTIAIAGRFEGRPPAAPENVVFAGRVPDAQAFVRGSRVIALATQGGTGVQLKTIETFEEGLPAVATGAALRGVDIVPENVRVANDAPAFAAALAAMVADERAGIVGRRNGLAFMLGQRHAMSTAIQAGLDHLRLALTSSGEAAARREAEAGRAVPPQAARGMARG